MKKHSINIHLLPSPEYIEVPNVECLLQTILNNLNGKSNYWLFLENSILEKVDLICQDNRFVIQLSNNSSFELAGVKSRCRFLEVTNIQSNNFTFETCRSPDHCLYFSLSKKA